MRDGEVAVVGAGSWGVALAAAAAKTAGGVTLVTRRGELLTPKGVTVTSDEPRVADAQLVVLAVPSSAAPEVVGRIAPHLGEDHIVVHASRGLVGDALQTISEVVRGASRVRMVGAVGGPAVASDLLAGNPSVVVCGASEDLVGYTFTRRFMTPGLRVYTTSDVRGVEWASALVGCLTTIVGYAQQLGLNAGIIAALITRGVQEAARIVTTSGGERETLLGLAGYGELLAAIAQRDRPEMMLGAALARGLSADEARKTLRSRAESAELVPRLARWIESRRVRAPIFKALADEVFAAQPYEEILERLMTLPVEDAG